MKAGWEEKPLEQCLDRFRVASKIQRKRFATTGQFPIVSQEAEFINGYWNQPEDVCSLDKPVVVFGDHTQVVKYVDFDFVVGADGVKVLQPKDFLDTKYLYYFVKAHPTPSLGYARHYRHIKEQVVGYPPLEEQQRIVAILDEAFEGLDRARENAEVNLQDAKELFENTLITVFDKVETNADRLVLSDAAVDFGRGRSRHRPRNAPILYGGEYPFIQTGNIRNSNGIVLSYSQTYNEQGLAQSKLWPEGTVCITIAANIAETAVLGFDACFPDSVIGLVADPEITFPEYVEFMLRYFSADLKSQGKGSAQDNINLGTFERATFPFPSIEEQRVVVEKLTSISQNAVASQGGCVAKLQSLDDLRQSLLQKAFAGELT